MYTATTYLVTTGVTGLDIQWLLYYIDSYSVALKQSLVKQNFVERASVFHVSRRRVSETRFSSP